MNQHLINKAADLFQDVESWEAFLELITVKGHITETWYKSATMVLRQKYNEEPIPGWNMCAWDGSERDTWWYLDSFGANSIGIGFGWRYVLCFGHFNYRTDYNHKLGEMLNNLKYKRIREAFRGDYKSPGDYNFVFSQAKYFPFNGSEPKEVDDDVLAWYAGKNTENFVNQALEKVRAFQSSEVTQLFTELNQEFLDAERRGQSV